MTSEGQAALSPGWADEMSDEDLAMMLQEVDLLGVTAITSSLARSMPVLQESTSDDDATLAATLAAEWAEEEAAEATRRREARAAVECEREGFLERERQVRLCGSYHPFSIAPSDSTVGV